VLRKWCVSHSFKVEIHYQMLIARFNSGWLAGWLVQIDCIDSPFMSEDMGGPGRPLVATLQTTCEGEQAECLPIVANMNEYFDEAVCLQPFPLSTPACNVTTHVV
jgi:hypothetical protein